MKIEIPEEDSKYMYDIIQRIIDEVGPRMPCSPAEAQGAEIVKAELEKTCDSVHIEPFTCHPRAFLGWLPIVLTLVLASIGCYFIPIPSIPIIPAILALTLNAIAFIIMWFEFFSYNEFIDRLFKEKPSQNVVGTIKSEGDVEQILIISGHHDSALQFNLLRYLKHGYFIIIFFGFVIYFVWFFISGVNLVFTAFFPDLIGFFDKTVIRILIIGTPAFVGLFLFVWPGERANTVPGAVDNLSAVAVVLGLGRYLQKHPDLIPSGTEIRLISFGCEEAGLRGAYRYAEAHLEELQKYDGIVLNMDGVMHNETCMIIENEPTTRTRHSKEVVEKLEKAAELVEIPINAFGDSILMKIGGLLSGGSDAAAFSKAKIKAATLASMKLSKFPLFYHQPSDTLDMISKGSLELALKVLIGYLVNESKSDKS